MDYELSEKLLDYEGRQLLVIQRKSQDGHPNVLVPGFIKNYQTRETPEGLKISDVQEVPEKLRENITEFLKEQGLEGNIIFW